MTVDHAARPSAGRVRVAVVRRLIATLFAITVASVVAALVTTVINGVAVVPTIDNYAQLFAASTAAAACWIAARRSSGPSRRTWLLFVAANGCWAIAQTYWAYHEIVLQRDAPFPSFADIFFIASVPFALAGISTFIESPARLSSRVLALVEASVIASGALLLSWGLVLGPAFEASSGSRFAQLISLSYPIGDILMLALILFATTRRDSVDPVTLSTLGAGYAGIALADSTFAYLSQSSSYSTGLVVDSGWIIGFALIAVAALRYDSNEAPRERTHARSSIGLAIPYVPVFIGTLVEVSKLLRGQQFESATAWITLAALAALCAHQVAVVFENNALTSGLESRVRERTVELAQRERHFAALIEHSSDVTLVLDAAGQITYASSSAQGVLGTDPAALLGRPFAHLLEPGNRHIVTELLVSDDRSHNPRRFELMLAGADGAHHPSQLTITNLLDEPAVRGIVVNSRDMTERHALEEQLRYDALHDSLTGLANRRLLLDHLQLALGRRPKNDAESCAVLIIDLDDFKAINDAFGHHSGDDFLISVAERLKECVRPGDTVARLGGDEFGVLLTDVDHSTLAATGQRLLEVLQMPVSFASMELAAHASIGIRVVSEYDTPHQILRDADIALYAAKSAGKRRYEIFDTDMGDRTQRRLTLKADLRDAWRRREISVFYQPIVHMASGSLRGAEALVRWTHPQFGTVSPVEFIPLAEETGVITSLGLEIMQEACRQAKTWCEETTFSYISVNVSPIQLAAEGFVDRVDDVLRSTGLQPDQLLLEVTEGVLFENFEAAVAVLNTLRDRGIRTAIDDFGTGYSSLSYAQHLPVDLVKIDRAFTVEVESTTTVIPAIMQIATTLGAGVVVEGIETEAHVVALQAFGCELGQGYLYSPPVPARSFEKFLHQPWIATTGTPRASKHHAETSATTPTSLAS